MSYIFINCLVGTCKTGCRGRCDKYWRSLQVGKCEERGDSGKGKWSKKCSHSVEIELARGIMEPRSNHLSELPS